MDIPVKTPGWIDPMSPSRPHLFDLQHFPRCARTVDQVQAHLRKVEAAKQMMTDIMDGTKNGRKNNSTEKGVKENPNKKPTHLF